MAANPCFLTNFRCGPSKRQNTTVKRDDKVCILSYNYFFSWYGAQMDHSFVQINSYFHERYVSFLRAILGYLGL